VQRGEVGEEDEHRPRRDLAAEHAPGPHPEHRGRGERGREADAELAQLRGEHAAPVGVHRGPAVVPEPAVLALLLRERLHHRHAAQRLLHVGLHEALDLAAHVGGRPHRAPDEQGPRGHDRRHRDGHERQHGIEPRHDRDERRGGEEGVPGGEDERVGHRVHAPAVAGHARERVADGRPGVEQQRPAQQAAEQVARQVVHHALPDPTQRRASTASTAAWRPKRASPATTAHASSPVGRAAPGSTAASRATSPRRRRAREHVVDHHLHRPGLQQRDPGAERRGPGDPRPAAPVRHRVPQQPRVVGAERPVAERRHPPRTGPRAPGAGAARR
jgi:hypothetical protein